MSFFGPSDAVARFSTTTIHCKDNNQHQRHQPMKHTFNALFAAAALCAVTLVPTAAFAQDPKPSASPAPSTSPSKEGVKYTCTMHPEVVQDKPGNCPKCGMKLVEKKK